LDDRSFRTDRVVGVGVTKQLLLPSNAVGGPGALVVNLHLTTTARKTLVRRHRLTLRVRITFVARGGKAATTMRMLVLSTVAARTACRDPCSPAVFAPRS
jgi:hypothetical protein